LTLRLRLLLLLVIIVATGLVISDVVTYTSLRSFLLTQVDNQLKVATFPVGRSLLSSPTNGSTVPPPPSSGSGTPTTTVPTTPTTGATSGATTTPTTRAPGQGDLRPEFGGTAHGADRGVLVPPGTYGELRDASGRTVAHVFFSYGGKAPAAPAIPASLPGSGSGSKSDLFFTTSSTGTDGTSYRALARPLINDNGTIVVAESLSVTDSTLQRLLFIELIVSALVLVILGLISWLMVRRDMRPLEEMAVTAGAIADGDLSQRVSNVTPGSEVGQLGVAFNTMIEEIEDAFDARAASENKLRRFLADASHELRTPLTSIRGYSEMFDLGIRDRPNDLATAMDHIKNEASRMGTLVDDLFLLAQLDHERPQDQSPFDLVEVAERSVAGVRVSAPARTVRLEAAGPVTVVGDVRRMRQVVDNLLVNSIRHTPDTAIVEVRVRLDGDEAVVSVSDDGPGIDPSVAARIFEPFFRADPSRARSTGGAGLGLAIVAAIVEAHGGRVTLMAGTPGATFEVRLPAASPSSSGNGAVPAVESEAGLPPVGTRTGDGSGPPPADVEG
jgi:two-component system OmpR family sensor kinase